MKNYRVRTISKYNEKGFKDLIENVWRNVGDEFYCTKERYEFLASKGAVELVEDGTLEHPYCVTLPHPIEEKKVKKSKKIDKK